MIGKITRKAAAKKANKTKKLKKTAADTAAAAVKSRGRVSTKAVADYIEEYGIESISDSFYEDSPNREVHSIQSITDDKGNFIYKEKK